MARYARRRKSTRPFRAMRKARSMASRGYGAFGRSVGRYLGTKVKNAVHWFRKEIPFTNINEGGINLNGVYFFQLSTIPDWPDFVDQYDQVLVKKIIITFEPAYSGSNTNSVAPFQKWMRVVHDYSDATALTQEDQYLDYSNCKSYLLTRPKPIRITLYPKVNVGLQSNLGTASFAQQRNPGALNTTDPQIGLLPMYGIKYFIPTLGLTIGQTIARIRVTAIIGGKNIR